MMERCPAPLDQGAARRLRAGARIGRTGRPFADTGILKARGGRSSAGGSPWLWSRRTWVRVPPVTPPGRPPARRPTGARRWFRNERLLRLVCGRAGCVPRGVRCSTWDSPRLRSACRSILASAPASCASQRRHYGTTSRHRAAGRCTSVTVSPQCPAPGWRRCSVRPVSEPVELWTDGACSGNPGPGGWAAILRWNGHVKEVSGGEPQTTNNRMELMSVIEGLRALTRPVDVVVHVDSAYVESAFTQGWIDRWRQNGWRTAGKQPVKNRDLWEALAEEVARHRVTWRRVAGHSGVELNERADRPAVIQRDLAAPAW